MNNEDALNQIKEAKNYNKWLFEQVKPYLKDRVLEIGCGIGNMTKFLLKENIDLTVIDNKIRYIDNMKKNYPSLQAYCCDIAAIETMDSLPKGEFNAVICINILEHIKNDTAVLQNIKSLLSDDGKLIIFVPAHPWLYSKFDKDLNHLRRYSKSDIINKILKVNLIVKEIKRVNMIGAMGGFLGRKILNKGLLSKPIIKIFDKMIPVFFKLEQIIEPPIGLSLWIICEKQK